MKSSLSSSSSSSSSSLSSFFFSQIILRTMAYDLCDECHLELTNLDCGCVCCRDCDDRFICEECNKCGSCVDECSDCSICMECHDECTDCHGCLGMYKSCKNCSTCELCVNICSSCELCIYCIKVCTLCKIRCSKCAEFPKGDNPSDRCLNCATFCTGCNNNTDGNVCYGCDLCDDCIRKERRVEKNDLVMKCTVCRRYCKWCDRHEESHMDCRKFQFCMNQVNIEEDHLKKIILSFII